MRLTFTEIIRQKTKRVITEKEVPSNMGVLLRDAPLHKYLALFRVAKKCKYCKKQYTYSLLMGDSNHGACFNARCILNAMRDTL